MGTGAGFHGNHATGRQLSAPEQEFVAREGATGHALATGINGMNLKNALGQIHTDSCNLAHGTSPSKNGLQIDFQNQSWHFDAVAREWEVPSYSAQADPLRQAL
jgi:hypothetical protein